MLYHDIYDISRFFKSTHVKVAHRKTEAVKLKQ